MTCNPFPGVPSPFLLPSRIDVARKAYTCDVTELLISVGSKKCSDGQKFIMSVKMVMFLNSQKVYVLCNCLL